VLAAAGNFVICTMNHVCGVEHLWRACVCTCVFRLRLTAHNCAVVCAHFVTSYTLTLAGSAPCTWQACEAAGHSAPAMGETQYMHCKCASKLLHKCIKVRISVLITNHL
jgi:hypothetical protein